MSGTGVNPKVDILPIPEKTHAVSDPDQEEQAVALADGPTASHALAHAELEEKGAVQREHEHEVKDLGWNEPEDHIPKPLVGGMDNEELWLLVRRFNKQMYHVKETTTPAPGNLDLNIADEDEFSPDKLRSTIERLYMTVFIGALGFVKHIMRLRSWKETRRTSCFAAAYFIAWAFDFLVPLFSATLIVLIAYEPSRAILFPPAPLALVDAKTGGVQKPRAGVLGSHDSATGAPENYKGEAVEAEASNFVNGIAHVALSSATGKHPQDGPEDVEEEEGEGDSKKNDLVPDPAAMAVGGANARQNASGTAPSKAVDKTKVPMETAMWTKLRPIMHILGDTADTWERFANALSPTPPFPQEPVRLRLAGLVVPLLAMSIFVTSYMFVKGVTFGIGFGFFGDPITMPALRWLNRTFPNWQKLLEVRNTILKGVPTNAQLTVTLLRLAEVNKAPLPPPPQSTGPPPDKTAHTGEDELSSVGNDAPLGATQEELHEAMKPDDGLTAQQTDGQDIDDAKDHTHGKKGSKILGFFRGTVKAGVETSLGADRLKATAGSTPAKNRIGVIQPRNKIYTSGPVDFKARFNGKKGWVYIVTKATIPCVAFSTDTTIEKIGTEDREDLHPIWSIPIGDLKDIKKTGGFGWKFKLVVGWALERTVSDGMEITDKTGTMWKVTALPLRDELFNRLVAMGGQKWESW